MLIDASHPIATGMPRIPVLPPVLVEPIMRIADGKPLNISLLHLATHAGTHIDAPVHAIEGAATIDPVPLERFRGPGAVVPVTRGPGEQVTVADVEQHGLVQRGDIVLLASGWDKHFHDDAYHDHPYPSVELAEWLVEQEVAMVGVDCITVDAPTVRRGEGFDYPVHRALLGAGIPIIENLCGLGPAVGRRVQVMAFPLPLHGGDAGHARVVLELD